MTCSDPLNDPFTGSGARWMDGRTALVTGAGQQGELPGVGYAVARVLAGHGARVAVLDRDPEAAERTVKLIDRDGGAAMAVLADVTDDRQVADAVSAVRERLGGLDAVVNNVAAGDPAGVFDVTPDRFAALMTVNLTSAWQVMRHTVPLLPRGAAIVNISSVTVASRGPGMVYSVAKAGLENLTDGAAATLGPRGIRVNCVRVGMIWGSFAAANMPEERRGPRREATGLRTEGTAWDVAQAALFLLSDRARWISGHTLTVDGGPSGAPPVAAPSTPLS
uniref:SDR family NAD(P)-dependent oxidoreductase n=1 Tax=Herbidospora sakaeratensis TaxID=564415 RepID=UPI000A8274F8|nr:SDR family oxidoreductase [Herbidospora sakaeratensis]